MFILFTYTQKRDVGKRHPLRITNKSLRLHCRGKRPRLPEITEELLGCRQAPSPTKYQ